MDPVFIYGCDRSGTTFLGSLLGTHSRCVTTPESQFVYHVYQGFRSRNQTVDLIAAANGIRQNFRFQVWNYDLDVEEVARRNLATYPELISHLVQGYTEAVGQGKTDVWIDHTPENCNHSTTLLELFPNAKFIHIVRDGRAVASSLMALPWKYHNARKIGRLWVEKIGRGLAAEVYLGPTRCIRVRYEDLLTDTENQVRRLTAFLGLDFEPEMLSGSGFAVPDYTKNEHALVGQPAEIKRINAWKQHLSERDIEIFEAYAGDTLQCLGYTPEFGIRARSITRKERYWADFVDVFYYRRVDGFKERIKRRRLLDRLRAKGYINRETKG